MMTAPCTYSTVAMETMPGDHKERQSMILTLKNPPGGRSFSRIMNSLFTLGEAAVMLSEFEFLLLQRRSVQVLWGGKATSIPVDCHRAPKVEPS